LSLPSVELEISIKIKEKLDRKIIDNYVMLGYDWHFISSWSTRRKVVRIERLGQYHEVTVRPLILKNTLWSPCFRPFRDLARDSAKAADKCGVPGVADLTMWAYCDWSVRSGMPQLWTWESPNLPRFAEPLNLPDAPPPLATPQSLWDATKQIANPAHYLPSRRDRPPFKKICPAMGLIYLLIVSPLAFMLNWMFPVYKRPLVLFRLARE
jgi:hypothetical protein